MSRISHQLRPKKTRGPEVATSVSRSIFMSCHDNARSVTFESGPEGRTDITIWRELYIYNKCHICRYNSYLMLPDCLVCSVCSAGFPERSSIQIVLDLKLIRRGRVPDKYLFFLRSFLLVWGCPLVSQVMARLLLVFGARSCWGGGGVV